MKEIENRVSGVECPDHVSVCPDDYTCCRIKDGTYGCCKGLNAECCDLEHCCPSDSTCVPKSGTCKKKTPILKTYSTRSYSNGSIGGLSPQNIVCPDGKSVCPNGNTCCMLPTKSYACCPKPEAVCCDDQVYCCPHGEVCKSDTCSQGDQGTSTIMMVSAQPYLSPVHYQLCPDQKTDCGANDTCCSHAVGDGNTYWACCPTPNAVCCEGGDVCCPQGFTCDMDHLVCHKLAPAFPMLNMAKEYDNEHLNTLVKENE